jgi:adenylate cyclase
MNTTPEETFEIERRFLVSPDFNPLKDMNTNIIKLERIHQGFLNVDPAKVIRVRIVDDLSRFNLCITAFLTVKGKNEGIKRREIEESISVAGAKAYLEHFSVGNIIEKVRYSILQDGMIWEVDFFESHNLGLRIAEVELKTEDQQIIIPSWVREEISTDFRYSNVSLSQYPRSS